LRELLGEVANDALGAQPQEQKNARDDEQ